MVWDEAGADKAEAGADEAGADEAGADEAGADEAEADETEPPAKGVRAACRRLPAAGVDDDAEVRFLVPDDLLVAFCPVMLNIIKRCVKRKEGHEERKKELTGLKEVEKVGKLDEKDIEWIAVATGE